MNNLRHHGIKGQKWGVRRYQNKDGSLTAEGRKYYGNEYKKLIDKGNRVEAKRYNTNMVKAYNKVADIHNQRKIAEYNKKHSPDEKDYEERYNKMFDKDVEKMSYKVFYDSYKNNQYYRQAQSLAKKYGMESYDTLVQNNNKYVNELRKKAELAREV